MSWQSFLIRLYLNYNKITTNWNAPVEELRRATDGSARFIPFPSSVKWQPVTLEHIPGEWLIPPQEQPDTAILFLHGGGYATGSIQSHRATAARLAHASRVRTLIIDYRLAPEHPYPAALQDAVQAYTWLQKNGYIHLIVMGDSAGGGLALATVHALRAQQIALPTQVVCLSPLTDVEGTGESVKTNARRDPWLKEEAKSIFQYYLRGSNNPRDPLISPLYADYTGFPPLLIHVGGDEIMLSDSTRLADKARAAGVEVQIKIWPGMWHVFPFFAPMLPEARQAIAEIGASLQGKVRVSSPPIIREV